MLAKAEEKGVQVTAHHQWRLHAWTQAIAQKFREGQIGELRYMFASGKGYYGGYGLLNIGTHLLNHLLKFAGHCRSVSAQMTTGGHAITPADVLPSPAGMGTIAGEYISANLQFDRDVTATLLQHRFDQVDVDAHIVELYGSEGRLLWYPRAAWWLPHPHAKPGGEDRWQQVDPIYPDSFPIGGKQNELSEGDYWFVEEYVNALDQGRDHECHGVEGRHVIEIMMGIFESAIQGTTVKLPQPNRAHPLLSWRAEAGLGEPDAMPRDYRSWLAAEDERITAAE